jgi:hypothetical protein
MDGALQGVAQGQAREIYEFDVPESLRNELVKESVGMQKLRGNDEVEATKRAHGDSVRLAFELVKLSLIEVDGRRLKRGDGEDETVWNNMEPMLRQLLLAAYAELHTPDDKVTENFLKARRIKVG